MSAEQDKRAALVEAILAGLRELLTDAPAAPAPAPATSGKLLRAYEVSARYDVDVSVVYRWTKSGILPHLRLPGGDLRFRPDDLVEFDRRRETNWTPPAPEPAPGPMPAATEKLVIKEHPDGAVSVIRQDERAKLSPEGQRTLAAALRREAARPTAANGGRA